MSGLKSAILGVAALGAFGVSFGGAAQAQAAPFTDWASVLKPGATVAVGGVAQEFTTSSGPNGVNAASAASTNMAVNFTETFTAAGDLASMQIQNANRAVSFVRSNGDTIKPIGDGKLIYGLSTDWARKALAADPLINGWKYQSFGIWVNGLGMAKGSMGSASVGAITAGTSVPQTGSATFAGLMAGIYNDAVGQDHLLSADMGLAVNFAAHTADFWTANTKDSLGADYADLNLTGYFLSLPNHPAIFGQLSSKTLFGTTSGQFYGPGAEEVGGVVTMTPKDGQGLERFAGAYGGKLGTPVAKPEPPKPPKPPEPPPPSFTNFRDALQPGATVTVSGFAIESTAAGSVVSSTFLQGVDSEKYASFFNFITPGRTVGFSAAGDNWYRGSEYRPQSKDGRSLAVVGWTGSAGYDYQTFGVWATGVGTGASVLGAGSYGAFTPANAIPTGGGGVFMGKTAAVYTDGSGSDHLLLANTALSVNFGARSASMSAYFYNPFFNINANLTYAAGENRMTGTATASDNLSGAIMGWFYGPNANEAGLVYSLTSQSGGPAKLVGSFGGRRIN